MSKQEKIDGLLFAAKQALEGLENAADFWATDMFEKAMFQLRMDVSTLSIAANTAAVTTQYQTVFPRAKDEPNE